MWINILFIFFTFCLAHEKGISEEVCLWGTFKANCSKDHVIIMEKAVYGQESNSSRCSNGTTGADNCSFDVLTYLDRICGGRQTCTVYNPNKDLSELQSPLCKSRENPYLTITYYCEYVYSAHGETCSNNQSLTVATTAGYLSSIVTAETKKGSSECPWKIRLNRNQAVRFSLLDFRARHRNITMEQGPVCSIYATFVLKHTTGDMSSTTACEGNIRQKTLPIYTSTAREVDISLTKLNSQKEDAIPFLIKYEVFFQCAEFMPPANAAMTKTSNGLRITCLKMNETSWMLYCVDGRWMPERHINCDNLMNADNTTPSFYNEPYPKWLLHAVPPSVLLPVGLLVVVGTFWKIRKQRGRAEKAINCSSSEHHYSDIDDQITPEIIVETTLESPDNPLEETGSVQLMPYSDLTNHRASPTPAVYLGLENNSSVVAEMRDNGTDDPSTTLVFWAPLYVN